MSTSVLGSDSFSAVPDVNGDPVTVSAGGNIPAISGNSGAPVGVPTYGNGSIYVDTLNSNLYFYSNTAVWKSINANNANYLGGIPAANYALSIESINTYTGTTYTLQATDVGDMNNFSNSSAIIVTVPLNANVPIPIGSRIDCSQAGTGSVTFTPAGGVTINSSQGVLTISSQYAGASLIKIATDTWDLFIGTGASVGTANQITVTYSGGNAVLSLPSDIALNTGTGTGSINLPTSISTTPAAAANTVSIFGRQIAGRAYSAAVGPAGLDYEFQPFLARDKVGYWNPPGNSATVPGVFGFSALTPNGTVTTRNVATTNVLTRMRRLSYTSSASAGNVAYQYSPAAQFTTGTGGGLGGFTMICRFGTSDAAPVSGARFFAGMTSSTSAPTNVDPATLTNCIGIAQISTDATQWYIVYGGSAAQTAIALGTGLGAPTLTNTAWELAVFCSPNANGVIGYQVTNLGTGIIVSGTLTPATPGTQTPANTTLLAWRIWRTNNATAAAVAYDLCSVYIETDN